MKERFQKLIWASFLAFDFITSNKITLGILSLANFHHESVLSSDRKIIQSHHARVDKEEEDGGRARVENDGERSAED